MVDGDDSSDDDDDCDTMEVFGTHWVLGFINLLYILEIYPNPPHFQIGQNRKIPT